MDSLHFATDGWEFFGRASTSPDGRFRFAWQDFDNPFTRSAPEHRAGMGQVLLLDGDQLRYRLDLLRPEHGGVANSGVAIVCDIPDTNAPGGFFYAFSPDGVQVIGVSFMARVLEAGIGKDGRSAWCTTCNAPNEDGSITAVLDLNTSELRGRFPRVHGWLVSDVALRGTQTVITSQDGITYHYAADGALQNADHVDESVRAVLRRNGSGYHVLAYIEDRMGAAGSLNAIPGDTIKQLLELVDCGLDRVDGSTWHARLLRRKGELFFALGSIDEAIHCLERAVGEDPKVGAKTLLTKLRKSRAATSQQSTGR